MLSLQILIVDDDDARSARIIRFLNIKGIATENISLEKCADKAKNLLRAKYFDVLILDVVLPKRLDEPPKGENGLAFLAHLTRSASFKKPEKIIGITAHLDDIQSYRDEFQKYCFIVLEANFTSGYWLNQLNNIIFYSVASRLARVDSEVKLHVLTVHGIRTFGNWQNKLSTLITSTFSGIKISSYKYGYFSELSFLVPFLRNIKVDDLKKKLINTFESSPDQQFIIFCHSFGTYLVAFALKSLVAEGRTLPIQLVVTSGSVLKSRFDWNFYLRATTGKIVNDCGNSDSILILSEILVYGTGMAGRSGFYGFENDRIINRHFEGGHSHYFDNHEFINKYWLPLLDTQMQVNSINTREASILNDDILHKVITFIGLIKDYIYIAASFFIFCYLVFKAVKFFL